MVHLYFEIFAYAGKLCKYIKNQALQTSATKQGHQGAPQRWLQAGSRSKAQKRIYIYIHGLLGPPCLFLCSIGLGGFIPILPYTPGPPHRRRRALVFYAFVFYVKFVLFPFHPLSLVGTVMSLSLNNQVKKPSSRAWKKKSWVPTPKLAHVARNRSSALQDNQSEPLTQSLH